MSRWSNQHVFAISTRLRALYYALQGTYLDVAARKPIHISNAYFFDRCLGWNGLFVELRTEFHEPLHHLRSCALLPPCVTNPESGGEKLSFIVSSGFSGIERTNKMIPYLKKNNINYSKTTVRCSTLASELQRYGEGPFLIDYLSLDVEGHELSVLRGIDWSKTKLNVLSIEVNNETYPAILTFLDPKGYKELDKLPHGSNDSMALGNSDVLFLA